MCITRFTFTQPGIPVNKQNPVDTLEILHIVSENYPQIINKLWITCESLWNKKFDEESNEKCLTRKIFFTIIEVMFSRLLLKKLRIYQL